MNVEPVRRVLDALGDCYALIGAHAMAARGYPRFTVDIDLLTTDSRVLDRATWTTIEREGVAAMYDAGMQTTRSATSSMFFSPMAPTSTSCSAGGREAAVIERSESRRLSAGSPIRFVQAGSPGFRWAT